MEQNTPTAADICDALGRKAIAERIGVGLTAVSNASVLGQFPAYWYLAIREMCAESGLPCPDAMFSFVPSGAEQPDAV